jgi:RNA polymerase sigma-70 factor (ECF subfamily)
VSSDGTPEEAADAELLRSLISSFLRTQPEWKRTVFIRRYFFFDPIASIARNTDMSKSAVKTALYRIRADLKEYLKKEGFDL